MRCGPFDAAFLPINGAVCEFPHRAPGSPFPADLDPEQAAAAAEILDVGIAIPMLIVAALIEVYVSPDVILWLRG